MNIRVVIADERQAAFFDASKPNVALVERGTVENAKAGLKDRDLETDRPGRRQGGTPVASRGGGSAPGHQHGVDGERSTEQHELTLFAKDIAQQIDAGRVQNEFDKLVIIAAPKMLGLLRQSLSAPVQALLAGEVAKDLIQHDRDTILKAVPREAFSSF